MKSLGLVALALLSAITLGRADPKPAGKVSLGAYLSMTGATASFGTQTHEGIQLAIEQSKQPVQLELIDTKGKPSDAAAAVTELADRGVIAIVGEVASSLTLAGAPVAQKRGVPMITSSSTNPQITDIGEMISRACMLDADQAYALAKFVRKLGVTRVAILRDPSQAYSNALATAFETEHKALGGTIVTTQAYRMGDGDWQTQLTAIDAAKPQAIFVPGYYTDAAAIAKQARALGIGVPLLGTDGWESDELATLAGSALDGSFFVTHFAADDRRIEVRNFVKAFKTKYKHEPGVLAALGYDATNIVLAALARTKGVGGADLAAAIRSTKSFAGVTGAITIDSKGKISKPATIVKIVDRKLTFAATIPAR